MNIVVAEHAGTCYGVQRALDIAFEAAKSGQPAQTFGPLIHNPRVVRQLEEGGVSVARSIEEVSCDNVILRSHGVLPQTRDELGRKGVNVEDATCPYVLRAQKAAQSLAQSHEALLVVGDSGHPEVEGLIAYGKLANERVFVASSAADLPSGLPDDLGIVVQTTQSEAVLDEVVERLQNDGKQLTVKNTICGATHVRQAAAVSMAREVDVVIVIGGKNSSNTTRLYQICAEVCPRCHHIEDASEVEQSWFAHCDSVGVAAGASTPKEQIDEVVKALRAIRPNSLATISYVVPGSPFDDAGFAPGCAISWVNGHELRDIIDWRWLTSEDEISVSYVDGEGESGVVDLFRDEGEPWGIEFDGAVFDKVKVCRNDCAFCFMKQLPKGMRRSLYLRDDDFRLSFLSGTFVTLTNITPDDEERIVSQRLSPLRFSLHASDPDVRAAMIGKNAQRGIDVVDRLLAAGIEFHAQIVLCPGLNDGDVLRETLEWAYERPGIVNVGIVPLGFSRHQSEFSSSFNDPAKALAVLREIEPFQERAWAQRETPWVFAADEFYLNAYGSDALYNVPPASFYTDFSLFEDGIGMLRNCKGAWYEALDSGLVAQFRDAAERANARCVMAFGCAMNPFMSQMRQLVGLEHVFEPLYVGNEYFGGNVNVTGLLVGSDVAAAFKQCRQAESRSEESKKVLLALPRVMLNDDGKFLDDTDIAFVEHEVNAPVHVVSCSPTEFLAELVQLMG